MTDSKVDLQVAGFSGYLSALARIRGGSVPTVRHFDHPGKLDESIARHIDSWSGNYQIIERTVVSYEETISLLNKYLLSEIPSLSDVKRDLLRWDIEEYFGLIAMSIEENADFHPLVVGPVHKLVLEDSESNVILALVVEIKPVALMLALSSRAA